MDDFEWETLYQSCKDVLAHVTEQTFSRDLGPSENGILRLLDEKGKGMNPSEIGRELGIQRIPLTAFLRVLEEKGLICHEPDPLDGRRSLIVLSKEYRAFLREERAQRAQRFGSLFDRVAEEDLRGMKKAFETAAAGFDEEMQPGGCNHKESGV